jgi:cation diffusion facilitator CzcD-associated flavoprotein CzcO
MANARKTPEVAILGAGLSGLCMGIQLERAGIRSFQIFEKCDRVGGTWRDNTYPGVACDVPSHLYSYSFELNPDWSRLYSPGGEIQAYCERVAERYALGSHLRFGAEVERIEFAGGRWRIGLRGGEEHSADVVVSAMGGLHQPYLPEFPGIERFEGRHFHSARWDHDHDLTGRRVAVIGSAASAIQIVPSIAARTAKLSLFQRTPNWILPRGDFAYSERARRWLRNPFLARLQRAAIYLASEARFPTFLKGNPLNRLMVRFCTRHIASEIADPELRAKLTPSYPPGCKRILVSDDFYATLNRDNVELVTSPIAHFEKDGIVTADGTRHEFDTVIFATGFQPFNMFGASLQVKGPGGRSLADVWKDGIHAHRTVAMPGFPNFFLLLGPNSGLGHNSVILMIEAQVSYVLQCVQALAERGLAYLEPRAEAAARYDAELQGELAKTIWTGSCKSWYQDARGRVFTLWPHTTLRYLWQMRRPALDEYRQLRAGEL